ncbi:fucolectin-like [Lissotriton helveticus]
MKADLASVFVCTLLLVMDLAVIAINPDCVFPFIFKGVTYESCAKKDRTTLWCATTSNYDKDHRWIECYGRGENVALGGRATQSSFLLNDDNHIGFLSDAINAIDGNPDSDFLHGSCSHAENEDGPWWRVDLLSTYKVHAISVTARNNYTERMNGAEILVGNSLRNNGNDNLRCGSISSIAVGATMTFQCKGMVGRYVNVFIRGRKEYLTLCEVQVFAELETGKKSSP